jgi:hypothetical protein
MKCLVKDKQHDQTVAVEVDEFDKKNTAKIT